MNSDVKGYSPWVLISRLSSRGRLLACVALVAAAVVITVSNWGTTGIFEFASAYVTAFFMLWLAITDASDYILPNKILLAWLVCRIPLMILTAVADGSYDIIINSAAGSLVSGILFLIVYYLSKRTLGGGDVKLSFVMGLSLTLARVLNAVFYGLIFCALFALVALLLKKMGRKDVLPLCPFLFTGMLAAYLLQIGG